MQRRLHFELDIKYLTPVRGQDGKFSDTQGKDFRHQMEMQPPDPWR
jgi:hypothetical protein